MASAISSSNNRHHRNVAAAKAYRVRLKESGDNGMKAIENKAGGYQKASESCQRNENGAENKAAAAGHRNPAAASKKWLEKMRHQAGENVWRGWLQ